MMQQGKPFNRFMSSVGDKPRYSGRLGLDYIISVLHQNRLRWYEHVLQKEISENLEGSYAKMLSNT